MIRGRISRLAAKRKCSMPTSYISATAPRLFSPQNRGWVPVNWMISRDARQRCLLPHRRLVSGWDTKLQTKCGGICGDDASDIYPLALFVDLTTLLGLFMRLSVACLAYVILYMFLPAVEDQELKIPFTIRSMSAKIVSVKIRGCVQVHVRGII